MDTANVDLNSFPKTGNRFVIGEEYGRGVFGRVLSAQENGKQVAIKIQRKNEAIEFIKREYFVLKNLCQQQANLIEFYGAYKENDDEIWFVIEVCMCSF